MPDESCKNINEYFAKKLISASYSTKWRFINQTGGCFLLPLFSGVLPTVAHLLFGPGSVPIKCYVKCISYHPTSSLEQNLLHHMERRRRVENCVLRNSSILMISGSGFVKGSGKLISNERH